MGGIASSNPVLRLIRFIPTNGENEDEYSFSWTLSDGILKSCCLAGHKKKEDNNTASFLAQKMCCCLPEVCLANLTGSA
jgi:hypothetical protein